MNCQNCHQPLAADAAFCPHCGTVTAASPVVMPLAPPPLAAPPQPVPGSVPATQAAKPKRGRMLAIGVGVLGLIGVGFIGFRLTQNAGSDFVGGASSPEGAVEQFAEAINGEDILGAFSFVAPDEVDGVADVVEALIGTLDAGTGGIGDGSEADVNVELTGLTAKMEGDNAAIVEFEIDGGIESGAATGPIGVSLPSSATFESRDLDDLFPGSGGEVQLVTVKLGGNWYISPMLSLGNLIAEANDLPGGDFDLVGEERAGGGSDPEDAVDQMFNALADFNVDDFAESLGGGEGRFATVFTDAIQELVDEIPSDLSAAVDVRLSPLDDGRVEVEEVEGSVSDFESSAEFSFKSDCVTVSDDFDSNRSCLLDEIPFESSVDDTVILDTVEEDGGTRVRLVPSAADIASRLVSASSRQLLLYTVRLEWADTAVSVAPGTDTDIDFDGRLYVVHEFAAAAGGVYSFDDEDLYSQAWIREGDGGWEETFRSLITPEDDATIRVVTYSEDDCGEVRCFPSGDGSGTLRVREVPQQAAAFPAVLSGELGPGDQIVFDLTVTEGQDVRIDLQSGPDVFWNTMSGDWGFVTDDTYFMAPGEYSLVIRNGGDSTETYQLTPSTPTTGFEGSSTTTVSLGDGIAIVDLEVEPGFWFLEATPLDGQDIVLVIDDVDCFADVGFQGDSEFCEFDVSTATTIRVEVFGFADSDDFGDVILELG